MKIYLLTIFNWHIIVDRSFDTNSIIFIKCILQNFKFSSQMYINYLIMKKKKFFQSTFLYQYNHQVTFRNSRSTSATFWALTILLICIWLVFFDSSIPFHTSSYSELANMSSWRKFEGPILKPVSSSSAFFLTSSFDSFPAIDLLFWPNESYHLYNITYAY